MSWRLRHWLHRKREALLTGIVWRLPRPIVYWTVVRAAVSTRDSYPGEATAEEMLKAMGSR